MNCRSAESLFSSYVEDEISQEERRAVETHLMTCRRCSQDIRELRATMSMLQAMPQVAPSRHFEEDLNARIRSGEGLRPSLGDLLRELLTPARLRPAFMTGAVACAVFIAVLLSPIGKGLAPSHQGIERTATQPATNAGSTVAHTRVPAPASLASHMVPRARQSAPVVASVARSTAAAQDSIVDAQIPGHGYKDEIVNDQFYMKRGVDGQDPSVVPVNETNDGGVYITF